MRKVVWKITAGSGNCFLVRELVEDKIIGDEWRQHAGSFSNLAAAVEWIGVKCAGAIEFDADGILLNKRGEVLR